MTDINHPTTPPDELMQQWIDQASYYSNTTAVVETIATQAARWGADQELAACCEHLRNYQWGFVERPDGRKVHTAVDLQLARRPKPPSLKEQALALIDECTDPHGDYLDDNALTTIRRALESLPD